MLRVPGSASELSAVWNVVILAGAANLVRDFTTPSSAALCPEICPSCLDLLVTTSRRLTCTCTLPARILLLQVHLAPGSSVTASAPMSRATCLWRCEDLAGSFSSQGPLAVMVSDVVYKDVVLNLMKCHI